jgi:superfamily II DNA or RNA helicase
MNAATNAGKTAAIAGIYLNLEGEQALLVLIHRKTVFTQLVKFFEEIDPNIGQITANVYNIQRITIAMIKTVYNRLQKSINVKKDLSRFSVVAVDECHLSGSKTYSKVLQNIDAPVRIFVSGTPFDSDAIIHKMIAIGLSGPEVIKITKRELMDKGVSLEVNVHVHLCNTLPFNKINTYDDYIRELINNSTERVLIMADIIKENIGKSTLIAVEEIDHGNKILRGLKTCFAYDSKVRGEYDPTIAFVHGEDPDREQKIKDFSNGKIKILISTRILKEGVNIPIIGNLIYAVGGKAKVDIKQWMGRMERKHEDDKIVTMHDFYDIGKYVENHSIKRIRTYKNEDLTVIEHYKREDIRKIKKAKTLES